MISFRVIPFHSGPTFNLHVYRLICGESEDCEELGMSPLISSDKGSKLSQVPSCRGQDLVHRPQLRINRAHLSWSLSAEMNMSKSRCCIRMTPPLFCSKEVNLVALPELLIVDTEMLTSRITRWNIEVLMLLKLSHCVRSWMTLKDRNEV